MKIHLGCGYKKLNGYINVDNDPLVKPDLVLDMETFPWPFEDNSTEYFLAEHILEHVGSTTSAWIGIWKELYRIAKPDAQMEIIVPHPRHDVFLVDPTHVRPVFPETIAMFDNMRNIQGHETGDRETKLGLSTGIDLEITDVQYELCEPWKSQIARGQISDQDMRNNMILLNNVCIEIKMKLRFIKPARGASWIKNQLENKNT